MYKKCSLNCWKPNKQVVKRHFHQRTGDNDAFCHKLRREQKEEIEQNLGLKAEPGPPPAKFITTRKCIQGKILSMCQQIEHQCTLRSKQPTCTRLLKKKKKKKDRRKRLLKRGEKKKNKMIGGGN